MIIFRSLSRSLVWSPRCWTSAELRLRAKARDTWCSRNPGRAWCVRCTTIMNALRIPISTSSQDTIALEMVSPLILRRETHHYLMFLVYFNRRSSRRWWLPMDHWPCGRYAERVWAFDVHRWSRVCAHRASACCRIGCGLSSTSG